MRIFIFLCCFFLASCCDYGWDSCQPPPLDCSLSGATAELEKQGAQIIETGETYTVIIPSDQLFYPCTADLRDDAILILEPLACFLKYYETTLMTINVYSDEDDRFLTERQAEQILADLSKRGLDARIIYARGYDGERPIADNSIPSHRSWNRRVEIKFRKVVLAPIV